MGDVVPLHEYEFFTWREGVHWICAWRRYDVVSHGDTEKEACERMIRQLAGYMIEFARQGKPIGDLRRPSANLLARWRRLHNAAHGN
jgi:hypothetical protein